MLAILTCASFAVVVALVVLELCPFVSSQLAALARIQQLLPVTGLVTGRTESTDRRTAFHQQYVDRVDCHARHRHRHRDLCLRVVSCFERILRMQVFPKVFGWMEDSGMTARLTLA